ncbi:MAG: hypothetical protein ACO1QB_17090 [Verrucomicrobiales bacterium]
MIWFLYGLVEPSVAKERTQHSIIKLQTTPEIIRRNRNQKDGVVFNLEMVYFRTMRSLLPLTVCAMVAGAALESQAVPRNLQEDYQPIVTRNPFDLKPIVVPPPAEPPPKPEPPKAKQELYLTGIASVGYPTFPKKAYLVIRESGTNLYYSLREDEKRDTLKLLKINDDVRPPTVKVEHNGSEMLLSFNTHSLPSSAGPLPGKPGAPGQPGMPQPLPGAGFPPQMNNTRPLTQPTGGSVPSSAYNGPTINGQIPGVTHIPSRMNRSAPVDNFGGGVVNNPAPGGTPLGSAGPDQNYGDPGNNNIDVAEQYLRLKLEETRNRQQGIPTPPIPMLE